MQRSAIIWAVNKVVVKNEGGVRPRPDSRIHGQLEPLGEKKERKIHFC